MHNETIVKQSTRTARAVVLIALLGASLIVAALLVERVSFQSGYLAAAERVRLATMVSGDIVLLGEGLSTSTRLAIATGDPLWRKEYDETYPRMKAAIAEALSLAPADLAKTMTDETVDASERLWQMQQRVFELLGEGRAAEAAKIVDSGVYSQNKAILKRGTTKFTEQLRRALDEEREAIASRAEFVIQVATVLSLIFVLGLWHVLNVSLRRSEKAFLTSEEEIRSLALTDPLTGLSNRRHFQSELSRAMARTSRSGGRLALIVLDLDRFKSINDRHGHTAGDALLMAVGQRLSATVRTGEMVARFGGDEFIAIIEFRDDIASPGAAAMRFIQRICEPVPFKDMALQVGASAGIALYPKDASTPEELLRKADIALFSGKEDGRGQIRAFDSAMDAALQERARVEEDLRTAISRGDIKPFYQPLVTLRDEVIQSFEVLARWEHRERGLIMPANFIPAAEETGLITEMTYSILRQACLDGLTFPGDIGIAVNVSPRTLLDPWFAERVLAILIETRFPASRLEIEITESALLDDLESARRVIRSLKNQSIKVSVDDFGAGYSSLGYLSKLPFDKIKIDQSFIRSMNTSVESAKIVTAIVSLGHSLGLQIVAEGIELRQDVDKLLAMGCTLGQGYLFARPMPAVEARKLIRETTDDIAARSAA